MPEGDTIAYAPKAAGMEAWIRGGQGDANRTTYWCPGCQS